MAAGDIVHSTETKRRAFEVFEGKDGNFYWREVNKGTEEIVATGGEGFETAAEAQKELEGAVHAAKQQEESPPAA